VLRLISANHHGGWIAVGSFRSFTKSFYADIGTANFDHGLRGLRVAEKRALHQNRGLFFKRHRQEIRFAVLFFAILAGLNYLYYLVMDTAVERFILAVMTAKPPAFIINLFTPSEQVVVTGTQMTSRYVTFNIVRVCEGMGGILLIISAICAVNMPLKDKIRGLLYGVTFMYSMNIFRIVCLYYVMRHYDRAFSFAHLFVGQSVTIILGCVFFVVWISRKMGMNEQGRGG
jgi:exosortase family protein XrtM